MRRRPRWAAPSSGELGPWLVRSSPSNPGPDPTCCANMLCPPKRPHDTWRLSSRDAITGIARAPRRAYSNNHLPPAAGVSHHTHPSGTSTHHTTPTTRISILRHLAPYLSANPRAASMHAQAGSARGAARLHGSSFRVQSGTCPAPRPALGRRAPTAAPPGAVATPSPSSSSPAPEGLSRFDSVATDAAVPEGHKGLHGFLYGEGGAEKHETASSYEYRKVGGWVGGWVPHAGVCSQGPALIMYVHHVYIRHVCHPAGVCSLGTLPSQLLRRRAPQQQRPPRRHHVDFTL